MLPPATTHFLTKLGVKPEKTQIRTKTYLLFEKLVKQWQTKHKKTPVIVDIGAGKGDNVSNLEQQNIPVIAVEPKYDPKTWTRIPDFCFASEVESNIADLVFNSYVLNVVPEDTAIAIIQDIARILKTNGQALVITRTTNDISKNTKSLIHPIYGKLEWTESEKVTSKYTYQKGFTFDTISTLFSKATKQLRIEKFPATSSGLYILLTKIV